MIPEKLIHELEKRKQQNINRNLLDASVGLVDFSSNDYLGFSDSQYIFDKTIHLLELYNLKKNGSTGSRLITGNNKLYTDIEIFLADTHQSESALLFNSGYTANLGLFSTVPKRGDIILYDELIHASIRDGISLSKAKSYKFKHNSYGDLKRLLQKFVVTGVEIYVVTETIFSMDGDTPKLEEIVQLTNDYKVHLILDEAHAFGVFGFGLSQQLNLEDKIFARVITFGKALGCHGAVILGSNCLKEYLVNFCRPFIYTTGIPPHSIATIKISYDYLISEKGNKQIVKLSENITYFLNEVKRLQLSFIPSFSAVQCCVIGGNEKTKKIAQSLQKKGFAVKPILYPTVEMNTERLRFCLHSFNSKQEITEVLQNLSIFVK